MTKHVEVLAAGTQHGGEGAVVVFGAGTSAVVDCGAPLDVGVVTGAVVGVVTGAVVGVVTGAAVVVDVDSGNVVAGDTAVVVMHWGWAPAVKTLFASNVTAPCRARARPVRVASVGSVMLAIARISPAILLDVPRVAELPTCQNTLLFSQLSALVSSTNDEEPVVKVLAIWKTNTPSPVKVSVPVNCAEELKQ